MSCKWKLKFKIRRKIILLCGRLHWIYTGTGKNSMPKLREVVGSPKTKIYCRGTLCRKCVLAALRTVILGLTKFGNRTKPLKSSEKICISYQFRADIQTYGHRPLYTTTTTQQRLTCALNNARLLPDCCCSPSGSGN